MGQSTFYCDSNLFIVTLALLALIMLLIANLCMFNQVVFLLLIQGGLLLLRHDPFPCNFATLANFVFKSLNLKLSFLCYTFEVTCFNPLAAVG